MQRSHFHAMVSAQGRVPSTEVISARLQPASAAVCAWLQLPALSSVIQICRRRRIDGRLVLYVEHYLNPQYFPGILACDLNESMTELYARKYDLHYGRVRFEIVPTSTGRSGSRLESLGGQPRAADRPGQLRSASAPDRLRSGVLAP